MLRYCYWIKYCRNQSTILTSGTAIITVLLCMLLFTDLSAQTTRPSASKPSSVLKRAAEQTMPKPGTPIYLSDIRISGLNPELEKFVLESIEFPVGEPLTEDKVTSVRNQLYALEFDAELVSLQVVPHGFDPVSGEILSEEELAERKVEQS